MTNSKKAARHTLKGPPFAPPVVKAADLKDYDLTMLIQFYNTVRGCIDDFGALTEGGSYAKPMFTLVDRRFVAPLGQALDICHGAIKAKAPVNEYETERWAALLYEHAITFDSSVQDKAAILLEALGAIPPTARSERKRLGKGEIITVKRGHRIIWKSYNDRRQKAA